MRLINFKCIKCGKDTEILVDSTEKPDSIIKKSCKFCGGDLKVFNFKNNKQVWKNPDTPRGN